MSVHKNLILLLVIVLNILIVAYIWSRLPQQKQILETDVSQEAQKVADECADSPGWLDCYRAAFSRFTKQHSLNDTIKVLLAVQDIDAKVRDCHILSHWIAIAEVEKNPRGWQDLLASIDPGICGGGFVHGVIEGLSRNDPNFKLDVTTLPLFCNDIRRTFLGQEEAGSIGCLHIMGHLLLVEENTNIPSAIKVCDTLIPEAQFQCFRGVFMENITRNNLFVHGITQAFPMDETGASIQENICRQYTGIAMESCWRELAHIYINLTHDPKEIFERCSHGPTEKGQDECYIHTMQVVTHKAPSEKYKSMIEACTPYSGNSKKYLWCVQEMIHSMLNTPKYTDDVIQFCNAISDEYKQTCYTTTGEMLSILVSPKEREQLCKNAPSDFKSLCSKT